jgi:hypothetical protein
LAIELQTGTVVCDIPGQTVAVESGRVGASQFTLEAKHIGKIQTHSCRAHDRWRHPRRHPGALCSGPISQVIGGIV